MNWTLESPTTTLMGDSPTLASRGYGCMAADLAGTVYDYNGIVDDDRLASIYSNALFEFKKKADTFQQKEAANWTNPGDSLTRTYQLAGDIASPSMPPRHPYYDLCPDGYLYFFAGLNQNLEVIRTFAPSAVDVTDNEIDLDVTPLCTGDIVQFTTSGGLFGGVSLAQDNYVIRLDSGRIALASTYANAKAGTRKDLTSQGTGTHTLTRQLNHPSDTWRLKVSPGAGQYEWEQLFPDFSYYYMPGAGTFTASVKWFPPLQCFVIANLGHSGDGNFLHYTTFLYYPPTVANPGGVYEELTDLQVIDLDTPFIQSAQSFDYDPYDKCIWAFGGGSYEAGGNEIWKFTATKTWTKITVPGPLPGARLYHGAAFSIKHRRLCVYGGKAGNPGANYRDLWDYDPVRNRWTQHITTTQPSDAQQAYLAWDEFNSCLVARVGIEVWTCDFSPASGSRASKGGMRW